MLAVFEAVATNEPDALAVVAATAGVPVSTAHRSLGVLADAGWIRATGPGRPRWVVSERVRALVAGPGTHLAALARPVLADLALATGETAVLWLADGDAVVAAAVAAPAAALRVVVDEGHRVPAHACAPGKSVLADRTDTEVRLGCARGMPPLTMRTIGDPEQLLVELRRIRTTGIAVARAEEASVAAALHGHPAAIGVVGPADRVEARLDELADLVRGAGRQLASVAESVRSTVIGSR